MDQAGGFDLRLFSVAEKSWAAISLHPKVIILWDIPYGRYFKAPVAKLDRAPDFESVGRRLRRSRNPPLED